MSTITPPPEGGNEILELFSVKSVEALATDDPQHDHLLYYSEADSNSILASNKQPAPPNHSPTAKYITPRIPGHRHPGRALLVMVVVAGCVPIRHDAHALIMEATSAVRTVAIEEPGCISHRFAFSLDAPDDLILIEELRDAESLAAHLSSAHFSRSPTVRPALKRPPSFTRYDIASAITTVRQPRVDC